jgi:hypothetical protein
MDRILETFLARQAEQGAALAAQSDLLEVVALGAPPQRFIARFRCKGLVREAGGAIVEAERFDLGIWMPDDYLRSIAPLRVVTWLGPANAFHPQIQPPFVCLGRLVVGTPLIDILYQAWEVITYRKLTMREDDALNPEACTWSRHNTHRFPVDPRPLKRRPLDLSVAPLEVPE